VKLTTVGLILWIANAALAALALAVLVVRGKTKEWPTLTWFLCFRLACELAQAMAIQHRYKIYFYTFWVTSIAQYFSQYFLLHEVFSSVLRTFPRLPKSFPRLLATLVAIASIAAAALAALSHTNFTDRVLTFVTGMQRACLASWCAAFLASGLATSWAGLGWKRDSILIGSGALTMNMAAIIASLLYGHIPHAFVPTVDHLQSFVELSVFISWSFGLRTQTAYRPETLPDRDTVATIKAIAQSTLGARRTI
jgi:hypothetical protein